MTAPIGPLTIMVACAAFLLPVGEALDNGVHAQVGTEVGSGEPGADRALRHRLAADAIDQFDTVDLDGRRWTTGDLMGQVVLLDFWATWCAPCLADLPLLRALRQKHARKDFEILGISLDVTSRRGFVSWLNRHRIDWPQVHLRQGYAADVPRLFGVEQLPGTVVIDRDGRVAGIDVRGDRLVALVDALVGDTP